MRPPGSAALYVLAIVLGGFVVLLGVALGAVVLAAEHPVRRGLVGPLSLAVLGVAAVVWAIRELRLPTPLDAPVRPSRLGRWLLLGLALLALFALVCGGGLFAVLYYLQEMM